MENFSSHNYYPFFNKNKNFFYFLGVILFLILIYFLLLSAPADFPKNTIFKIEKGTNLRNVSSDLKEKSIIRSRIVFEAFVIMYGGEKHIIFADYLFEDRINSKEVARRISKGEHHIAPIKITIPEGFNIDDINTIVSSKLEHFDSDEFLLSAKELEGYLFPDTYFFLTTATTEDVLKSLTSNFKNKISSLEKEIEESGKSKLDIIKMASIIEKEARGDIDRKIISGILWKRFSIKMPLQADAAPETYEKLGLPQHPIGNPGLLSIKAAIHPKSSAYLYYLHDKDGNIHYAKSFTEHRKNISKYLK